MDDQRLARLAQSIADFWRPAAVPSRALGEVSAVQFLREHVALSQPLVFTDLPAWPCLTRWSDDYLLSLDAVVSVNLTPDGRADSVDGLGRFVKPLEERMHFRDFWRSFSSADVPYLSRQNDSLREEFPELVKDVPDAVPLARDAFGNEPEAVNLWIGDDRSVSSCHSDPYENFYMVVRGEKKFTLFPPACAPFLHEQMVPAATYVRNAGRLEAVLDGDGQGVPWIPFDVAEGEWDRFPRFAKYGRDLGVEVTVKAGEMLYLPAMWYHRVAQHGLTIAVNYWHDMQIGHAYLYHQFLRDACGLDVPEEDGTA